MTTLDNTPTAAGFNLAHCNGRDAEVPANGVYLYKLIVKSEERRLEEKKKFIQE